MINCQSCKSENPDGAKFCVSCGSALQAACTECGSPLPAQARFCPECGHQQGEAQPDSSRATLERYIPKALLEKLEAVRSSGGQLGERRVVTMLFCDVTGSTAAAEKLDPEEWAEIINGAFAKLIEPVYRYEGTLARLMGDAILAFFGAPIAHEDDPQRAVLAALDILEAIGPYREEVKRKWGIDFEVRVGINTGLVVVGEVGSDLRLEYTALGDAINTAARMEQTAQPGTIQISADTQTLVAPLFDFEDLGGVEVKGKSEPVRAFRVLRRKAQPERERGIVGLESPMIGRDDELQTLENAVAGLQQGRGQIVSLIGDAGLGKSRIISELYKSLSDKLDSSELKWHEGRSRSYETANPYTPFVSLFTSFFGLAAEDSDEEKYGQIKRVTTAKLPEDGAKLVPFLATLMNIQVPEDDAELIRYLQPPQVHEKIFHAVQALLGREAQIQPLVLVFEDLHWADPTSLELLETLFSLTDRGSLMLLGVFRPVRQDLAWRFHENATRDYAHRYTSVAIEPLGEEDSRSLVGHLLEVEDLPEKVRSLILSKAEGNPFFVEEVIRSLLDSELIVREGSHWRATKEIENIALPDTLTGVITARLDRLNEQSRSVAQTASVIGREFMLGTLEQIFDGTASLEESLTDLQRRELIREKGRVPQPHYMYKHILTQEAAYSSLLLSRRRELHRRVAECFEREDPDQHHEIARHFLQAGEQVRAVPYLVEAGEHAARAYSSTEAIGKFNQALEILADAKDVGLERRAYEGLGGSLTAISDVAKAVETYHKMYHSAQDFDDSPMQVSALNKLGFLTGLVQGQFPEAEGHLAEAERLARESGDFAGLAELQMTYCYMRVPFGEFDEALQHLEEAAEIGRNLELDEPRLFGLTHIANTLNYMTRFDESREKVLEALSLAEQLGNKKWQSELLGYTTPLYHLRNGDLDAAFESAQQGQDLAASIGAAEQEGYANIWMGVVSWFKGDYEAAVRYYEVALAAGRTSGLPYIQVSALCAKGAAQLDISAQLIDQILEAHTEALELMESPLGSTTGGLAWADLGFCFMLTGNPERAEEMFQNGLNTSTAVMYLARPLLLVGSAFLALGKGEIESADDLIQEAKDFAEERKMKHFYPLLALVGANLSLARGDSSEALEFFERAESLALEMGMRGFAWQASAGAAGVLSESGRSEEASAKKAKSVAMVHEIAGLFQDESLKAMYLEGTLAKIG
ncbi:MAG: AAA family ATPase [Chloroflexi bacterium]|nr:AAA family ATPase [Chloroflexota bacterium]